MQETAVALADIARLLEAVEDPGARVGRALSLLRSFLDRVTRDAAERERVENRLHRQNVTLTGIARIFEEALASPTEEEVGRVCLEVAEEVTQSRFGLVGEVNHETGLLDTVAISDPGWEACRMEGSGRRAAKPIGLRIRGLHGRVVRDGASLVTNAPSSHPDSIGTPPGHPPITAFLGVPLLQGGKTIGILALGNRPGGYGPDERETAEALAPVIVQALLSKRAEAALRLSEHKHRVLIDTTGTGFAIVDEEGKVLDANLDYARLARFAEPRQVIGRRVAEWTADHDRARNAEAIAGCLTSGRVRHLEVDYVDAEGRVTPVEVNATVLQTAEGLRILSLCRDITDRRRVEESIRLQADEHATMLATTADGFWRFDADGKLLDVNDAYCRMSGYSREELLGMSIPDLEALETHEEIASHIRMVQELGFDLFESRHRRKDGSIFDVEISVSSWRKTGQFLLFVRDITERKRAEADLRRHQERLEELISERTADLEVAYADLESFSYSVSHDLRAPLRAIDGFSRILLEDHQDRLDDEGKRLFALVRDRAALMAKLIDDILAFSRMGRTGMSETTIDMTALTGEALESLRPGFRPGLSVEIGVLPPARGDREMIRQVLVNLLSNAIKFAGTRTSPRIEVGGAVEQGKSVYSVRDNGVGFDMKYAGKLFGVFQRLHRRDEFEGTGIGLAIVKRVVERHGGRAWAESVLDEGAAFHFALPSGPSDPLPRQ